MNYRVLSTLLLPFVFCSPSFAEDEAESKPLSAELSLGVLNTSVTQTLMPITAKWT